MLEFLELKGLAQTTVLKKSFIWAKSKEMSFPLKILAINVPPFFKTWDVILKAYS
jgi:hypothetical protein